MLDEPLFDGMPWSIDEITRLKDVDTRLYRIYESITKSLERENAVINFRITWSITLTFGLFAAEAAIQNFMNTYRTNDFAYQLSSQIGIVFMSAMAALFCRMAMTSVTDALVQIEKVKILYDEHRHSFGQMGLPSPYIIGNNHVLVMIFPALLMFFWTCLLLVQGYYAYSIFLRHA